MGTDGLRPDMLAALALLTVNATAFCLMGVDKRRAKLRAAGASEKKVRRIPEATLLLWAACFGGVGAVLGMHLFWHKTRHWYFRFGLPVMAAVQVLVLALWRWPEVFEKIIAAVR